MVIEYWKPVVGYEGLYEVSSRGRVRSVDKVVSNSRGTFVRKGIILKQNRAGKKRQYLTVALYKNGQLTRFLVHRIVAIAFIPNPLNLPCVNHKNEIGTDNFVENLEWCDQKYNINYGTLLDRRAKQYSKPINQYTTTGVFVKQWCSLIDIQRTLGYSAGYISEACRGQARSKHPYGFVWRYA